MVTTVLLGWCRVVEIRGGWANRRRCVSRYGVAGSCAGSASSASRSQPLLSALVLTTTSWHDGPFRHIGVGFDQVLRNLVRMAGAA